MSLPLDASDRTDRTRSPAPGSAAGRSRTHLKAIDFEIEMPNAGAPALRALPIPSIYWSDSMSGERWIALGEADRIDASPAIAAESIPDLARERLRQVQCREGAWRELRYFGGIAFDAQAPPHPAWPAGSAGRFILPRILLRQKIGERKARGLRIQAASEGGTGRSSNHFAPGMLEDIFDPKSRDAQGVFPALRVVESEGRRARFEAAVARALRAIGDEKLRKVVLSRDLILEAEREIDPGLLVSRVAGRGSHGIQFAFRFDGNGMFFGSTPERLFVQAGRSVASDCLAGTAPRGGDSEADRTLARGLIASEKDRREHQFVLDGIVAALSPLCRWIEAPSAPVVQALPMVQHLHTPVSGWLREEVALGEIIRALHPTPAVGGAPRDAAIQWIRELEERPRGWYAGAIGAIGIERADFGVGIRSAIHRGRELTVFGGAGIVRGSEPSLEWEETARKAASLISLFAEEGCPTPI